MSRSSHFFLGLSLTLIGLFFGAVIETSALIDPLRTAQEVVGNEPKNSLGIVAETDNRQSH